MKAPEVVRRYAATLLDAAAETQVVDRVRQDVERLNATLGASAELASFLADRLIDGQIKSCALEQLFGGKVEGLTLNFLLLLCQRRRTVLMPEILVACTELFDERAGVVTAEVRSAVELSQEQLGHLRERLSAYTGKEIRLRTEVDKKVRGGLIAQVGDTVFDGSLTTHLERLHRQLVGA